MRWRLTGSAASTPCGSAVVGSYEVFNKMFYKRKGRGLGRGSVRDWSSTGPWRIHAFCCKTHGKPYILAPARVPNSGLSGALWGVLWDLSGGVLWGFSGGFFGVSLGVFLSSLWGLSGAFLGQVVHAYMKLTNCMLRHDLVCL